MRRRRKFTSPSEDEVVRRLRKQRDAVCVCGHDKDLHSGHLRNGWCQENVTGCTCAAFTDPAPPEKASLENSHVLPPSPDL